MISKSKLFSILTPGKVLGVTDEHVIISEFDKDHWMKVYSERRKLGLPKQEDVIQKYLPNHYLLNARMVDMTTGKGYIVEKVFRQWYHGWFIGAILNHNGSHRVCYIENISCKDSTIIEAISEFNTNLGRVN